jgi:hypothetical protein
MTKKTEKSRPITPAIQIERHILLIRGEKVMLDADLAVLYQVQTRALTQAVKRNSERFPEDFMFQLSKEEFDYLRSQTVTSSWGGRRYPPYAFTEQGVAMLSSVLRSTRAVQVNVEIMRAFVRLRRMLASNRKLEEQLNALERKYDKQFRVVFDAIRQLMEPPESATKRPIGFVWDTGDKKENKGR